MISEDIQAAIEGGKKKALQKALTDKTLDQAELDACFLLAATFAKKPILQELQSLGTISQEALQEALFELVKQGKDNIVELFIQQLEAPNTVDGSGRTLLSHAAEVGKKKLISLLLAHGAEVDLPDSEGNTPLYWSMNSAKENAVQLLHEQGGSLKGKQVHDLLSNMVRLGKDKLFALFVDDIEDVNALDKTGKSLLSYAAIAGKQKPIDLLLARGADVNKADKGGETPLHWAFRAKKAKAAKTIIEHGVEIRGEEGLKLISQALNVPIKELLVQNYLKNRDSNMTKEAFIQKWGPIEKLRNPVYRCDDPLENPIMKGSFYTVGYFPSHIDPTELELDWEAVDAAKSLAEQICGILKKTKGYIPGSEGSDQYSPIFIPSLGRSPKTADFDAVVPAEAKEAGRGAYEQYINSYDQYGKFFTGTYFDPDDLFISEEQYQAFMEANALVEQHLTRTKKYLLYPDFVTFPVIFGGLDKYFNFVGVIAEMVWT